MTRVEDIPLVIERLCAMYDESVANLRNALARYLKSGERPDPAARGEGQFAYPELRIDYRYQPSEVIPARSFGRLNHPGAYATSIARPYLFRKYLTEQLTYLIEDYDVEVSVGRSASEIPYPYVLDGTDDLRLDGAQALDLGSVVPDHRARQYRRRTGRRRMAAAPRRLAPAFAVRRPARGFQPGAASPLHRHPGRAHPALPLVHQLCPLCRRVRPLGGGRT